VALTTLFAEIYNEFEVIVTLDDVLTLPFLKRVTPKALEFAPFTPLSITAPLDDDICGLLLLPPFKKIPSVLVPEKAPPEPSSVTVPLPLARRIAEL